MSTGAPLTAARAREVVRSALLDIVPDADLDAVGDDGDLRRELELDSLDFLGLVERLASATGRRIDEDDYPRLRTVGTAVAFLSDGADAADGADGAG